MTVIQWLTLLLGGSVTAPPTFVESAPIVKLDPLYAITAGDHRAAALVYDTILIPTHENTWSSQVLEDWYTQRDGSLRLVLKPKRRWHDGELVVGADVCASLAALRHPETIATVAQLAKAVTVDCRVD